MMLPSNSPNSVTNVVQTTIDLISYLNGTAGFGQVTADGVDDRDRTTVRDALESLKIRSTRS